MSLSSWIGQTIGGRYEIQELLGQGGMSAVYKAYDPNLRRVVAVKIIHPHLSTDAQFVARFEEEAAAVAQLRHPNIIQVYDFNSDKDTYYIVFEYVPGETVQARLKRMKAANRTMDMGEAIKVSAQVADGLQNAHNKGLIHRDIKPANIILNVTSEPIIMDFGIAKIMGGTQHTATGAVLGTARYMSPEQIKGEQIDQRTDIYSLGVTLFEMLGGRPPFEANSAMSLMMMHMTDPIPDLNAIRSEVSPELVAIVNKSLAKNPDDRYQTATQMAAALRSIDRGTGMAAAATLIEPPTASAEKTVIEPYPSPVDDKKSTAATTTAVAAAASTGSASSMPAAAPAKTGGSRTPLYIGGAILLLIILAAGVWAVFFRDTGGTETTGGEEEVPAVVVDPTNTPDAAGTQAAIDTGVAAGVETQVAAAAAQTTEAETQADNEVTETAVPQPTDTLEPTDEPTPEAQETDEAVEPTETPIEPVEDSVASVDNVEGDVLMVTANGEQLPLTEDTPITVGSEFITGSDGQLEITLEDDSILQMLEESRVRLDALGNDPGNTEQQTAYTQFNGDILLRVPPGGSEQTVYSETGVLLATLINPNAASDAGKQAALAKRAQQTGNEAAMTIHMEENRVFIACFSGICSTTNDLALAEGWEKVITYDGAFLSSHFITNETASYELWQTNCVGCFPEVDAPIPTATTTPTAEPTSMPTATMAAESTVTATPADMTGTPTAEATEERTEDATPTVTPLPTSLTARITGITLVDGRYFVDFQTIGYTAQLPGTHVHFYFDTVSEAAAGVPGAGPWKLYGGPSPFTEYAQADHVFEPTAMCIRVAREDHSILFGSGNCFPLPQ